MIICMENYNNDVDRCTADMYLNLDRMNDIYSSTNLRESYQQVLYNFDWPSQI